MRISDWSSDVCSSDLWQNQLRAREDHLPSQERYSPRVCGYCTEPTMKREGRRVRKQGEIIGRTLTTLSLLTNLSLLLFFFLFAEDLSTVKRPLVALVFCVLLFLFFALLFCSVRNIPKNGSSKRYRKETGKVSFSHKLTL